MLHIGRDKIYHLLRTGQLRSIKLGKRHRITAQHLAQFLAYVEGPYPTEHAGAPRAESDREHAAHGRLSPYADAAAGTLGWQISTRSHRLALTVATTMSGGTVHSPEEGEWRTRIPQAILMVMVVSADAVTLWCRLSTKPDLGVFALTCAPWPIATVLKCPLTALPTHGQLLVRDVRVTTRMGRTVRYLVPVFTTS